MKILELYSGIGGMHMAFKESGITGEVKAAIEINNIANEIYKYNFPDTELLNLNIEGLTVEKIEKLDIDTILMSPPCQPFSRNGNQNDVNDHRTDSFRHILNLLPKLDMKNILIENVKGFELSEMRNILINVLEKCNYNYQEFILSPSQFNIPNCRHRYYCLARKTPFKFTTSQLMEQLPLDIHSTNNKSFKIRDILDENVEYQDYCLPESVLKKRLNILDVCHSESKMSCCFTKAYGRYIEGTGSVLSNLKKGDFIKQLEILKTFQGSEENYMVLAKALQLRFFTPAEITRLMCFPKHFSFPSCITKKQRYMVLGNSINVRVVSYLIKLLEPYLVIYVYLYHSNNVILKHNNQ